MVSKSTKELALQKTLKLLDNKFKIEIIYILSIKKMRFGEIKKRLAIITQQLLTKQLKQLENDNFINREKFGGFPRKVEYSLTSFGKSLKPTLIMLKKLEENNIKLINKQLKKKITDRLYDYF